MAKRLLLLALIPLFLLPTDAPAAPERTERKAYIQGLVNGQRSTRDRVGLVWATGLAECAQEHAVRMANAQHAYHSGTDGDGCNAREIVGEGPRLAAMFAAFWRSDGHRVRILCACGRLGVGVVQRFGTYYVVVELR